jgi:hypothetical protein
LLTEGCAIWQQAEGQEEDDYEEGANCVESA